MRYLSVCSGIEAATVAWHPLGWTPAGFSEIEPFPRAVLEQRHGGVAVDDDHRWSEGQNFTPLFGDFTKIEADHVGPVDLLVGGTPCQSFSVAGKRLGLDDPRGNLAIEFLALAKRVRARWVVWENVPGVYSSWSGEPDDAAVAEWVENADFVEFLNLFRECGYRGAWRTIDAQYVRVDGFGNAVPQRRRRVFLVGHLGDDARALPVLFDPESLRGLAAPRREAGKGSAAAPGRDIDGDSGVKCAEIASTLNASFGSKQGLENQHVNQGCPLFVAENVAHTLRAEGFDASEDGTGRGTGRGTPIVAVPFDTTQITSRENRANPQAGDPCHPLQAGAHPPSIAFQARIARNGRGQPETICPTLNGANAGATSDMRPMAAIPSVDGWAVRKLTPRECERLQGFPDDFTLITVRGKPAADGPRYKAIGNSMAVNVMRWIGMRIDLVERACEAAEAEKAA